MTLKIVKVHVHLLSENYQKKKKKHSECRNMLLNDMYSKVVIKTLCGFSSSLNSCNFPCNIIIFVSVFGSGGKFFVIFLSLSRQVPG